jgi:hypothetical protein
MRKKKLLLTHEKNWHIQVSKKFLCFFCATCTYLRSDEKNVAMRLAVSNTENILISIYFLFTSLRYTTNLSLFGFVVYLTTTYELPERELPSRSIAHEFPASEHHKKITHLTLSHRSELVVSVAQAESTHNER